jgi:hypothetical protein
MEAFIVVPKFSSRPFENEQICVHFTFCVYREHSPNPPFLNGGRGGGDRPKPKDLGFRIVMQKRLWYQQRLLAMQV